MDENVFRIVVTVAVVIASLAFLVQAGIMLALYKVARKTQGNAEGLIGKVEPVLAKVGPTMERAGAMIDRVGPVLDRMGPVIDQAIPAIEKAGGAIDDARMIAAKAGKLMDRASEIAATTNLVVADVRPQVKQISEEALEVARLGREQVERIGELLHDANDKARARLDQIDQGVDNTIEHVEQVGSAVKRAAMIPVREVNGLAAGVSAAIGTLMRHRRSSVDSATQDEEMFI